MKKNESKLFILSLLLVYLIVTYTCRKLEKEMRVSTGEVTSILTNSAEASGMVVDLGDGAILHGHCYDKSPDVTTAKLKTQLGVPAGTGGFTSNLTNLDAGTKYYIRAYLSDGAETVYGKETSFTTVSPSEPIIATTAITSVTATTAISGGNITNDGGAPVTARGVCWSTATDPTILNSKTSDESGTGSFSSSLISLNPGTTYYVRAYATNIAGTGYGDELSFSTNATTPILSTTVISSVTSITATSGGDISTDGGAPVTERGVCWNVLAGPTTADAKTTDGSGTGSFSSSVTGLTAGTTYYVRAYATNSAGTAYGDETSFTTSAAEYLPPTLSTVSITSITSTTAESGGNITSDGGASVTARGVCWSVSTGPTIADSKTEDGSGTGSYASNLTGLTTSTTYYIRAYATNSAGTAYGNEVSFSTSAVTPVVPTLTTTAVTSITTTTASSGGNITSDGGATITASGVCWSTTANPDATGSHTTDVATAGTFTSSITGLTAITTYYVRAYATNNAGTAYGNELSFTTSASSSCTSFQVTHTAGDVAPVSKTVNYGTAETNLSGVNTCWITQNLGADNQAGSATDATEAAAGWYWQFNRKQGYKHDGATRTPGTTWIASIDESSDWTVANDPCLILLGTDWRIPTLTEWTNADNNGGWSNYNDTYTSVLKLHAAGNLYYNSGSLYYRGSYGFHWSGQQFSNTLSWYLYFSNSFSNMDHDFKAFGFSVRCLKGEMPAVPTITTSAITSITTASASSGGNITSDGGASVTARGVCWNTTVNPTTANSKTIDGMGTGSFISSITGLTTGTIYHVRAYAANSAGTGYGEDVSFTTCTASPTVTTTAATGIGLTSATLNGTVNANNSSATVTFEYGTSTSYGINVAANPSPVTGITPVDVSAAISGLTSGTEYHFRVKAVNAFGTTYGSDIIFNTGSPTVTDADGNVYNTITIGTQIWMTENLKTTKYRDGTGIPNITGTSQWMSAPGGAYCDYDNTPSNSVIYGRLYNWYSVIDGHYLCPTGWHVPTQGDWTTLVNYLGGVGAAGGKLKETGFSHWSSPNTGATNETGFTALPGGYRYTDGIFYYIGNYGFWWSSSYNDVSTRWDCSMNYNNSNAEEHGIFILDGLSVRCLQGEDQVLPLVSTTSVSAITSNSANSGGDVTSTGGSTVTARGVCWSTSVNPTTSDSKTTNGTGGGSYTSNLTGLIPCTTYYVRAYATNSIGTSYGGETSFTTSTVQTTVTTTAISGITSTAASSGGNVTGYCGSIVTARGVCWSTSPNPTTDNSYTNNGVGSGSFSSSLTGLSSVTTYYVRAYATNSAGTEYGNEVNFTTLCGSNLTIIHTAGDVAPVSKTVSYGTIETNLTGANKCWITQNLGADNQATSATDASESAAGWYWQFNRQQGFKHDGATRTPNTTWIATIDENSDWTAANDPCAILLGMSWRIPSNTEWTNTDNNGGWDDYNETYASVIKLHPAGVLDFSNGSLLNRGSNGYYWSSIQSNATLGFYLSFGINFSFMHTYNKAYGMTVRCIHD